MVACVEGAPLLDAPVWDGVLAVLARARGAIAGVLMSEADRALLDAARELAHEVGAPLLQAKDRGDLVERIDQSIEGSVLFAVNAALVREAANMPELLEGPDPTRRPWPKEIFGGAAQRLDETDRLMVEFLRGRRQLLALIPPEANVRIAEALARDPLGPITHPDIPAPLRALILEGYRGEIALMALLYFLVEAERPEAWLGLALADLFYDGTYARLRVQASFLPSGISTKVVPLSDRLDLAALEAERKEAETWLREVAAGEHGDALFPFAESDER